jgi:ABC-2 type transport system ATP-binding protein
VSAVPPALAARDLTKSYPGGRGAAPVRALDGLSVELAPGTIVALLGRNGAGKSTAVKILSTLARADSGTATVAGHDVRTEPDAVRRAIGLVSQKPSGDPLATGRENLALAGRIQGLSRAAAAERAAELLDRFDLAGAADRLTRTYSGGMARKLDVALGLVHRPAVLFLDEPTTGLDPEARAQLWSEIERLTTDERTTVLLTTHYLDEADRLADRIAIVDAGRVVVDGTPERLKSELRGDTVQVELAAPSPAALTAVGGVAGLREPALDGTRLRARAESGARAVPAVLAALEQVGVDVVSVTVARPSLDDVYLRHVGRSFAEAEAAA